jgi:hypothetical protein
MEQPDRLTHVWLKSHTGQALNLLPFDFSYLQEYILFTEIERHGP